MATSVQSSGRDNRDEDANILSTLNFQQAVGARIYNLTNRTSVARIPAGAIFESDHMAIPVPLTAPDEVTLRLDIANIYSNLGKDNQVTMRGFGTTGTVRITETEYTGDITTIDPAVTVGRMVGTAGWWGRPLCFYI